MKRLLFLLALILTPTFVSAQAFPDRSIALQPYSQVLGSLAAMGTTYRLDSSTEQIGCKFYASSTNAIDAIDMSVTVLTATGINFTMEIQADSSDTPSGTALGAATSAFAGPAATGFTGLQTHTTTGTLTLNAPYWIVVKYSSGTIDSTHYIEARSTSANLRMNREKIRMFNGTDWTTVAASTVACPFIVRYAGGSTYRGFPYTTASETSSAQTNIYSTNRQGLRFKYGSQIKVLGMRVTLTKTGSPSSLDFVIYENTTEKQSQTIAAADITSTDGVTAWFASPVLLAANTNLYAVWRQTADGGSSGNDYDIRTKTCSTTYISSHYPDDYRYVAGSGSDPTAFSVITTECPNIVLFIQDPAVEFDEAGGGGGSSTKHVIGN